MINSRFYTEAMYKLELELDKLLIDGWKSIDYDSHGARTSVSMRNDDDSFYLGVFFGDDNTIDRFNASVILKRVGNKLVSTELWDDRIVAYDKDKALDLLTSLTLEIDSDLIDNLQSEAEDLQEELQSIVQSLMLLKADYEVINSKILLDLAEEEIRNLNRVRAHREEMLEIVYSMLTDLKEGEKNGN